MIRVVGRAARLALRAGTYVEECSCVGHSSEVTSTSTSTWQWAWQQVRTATKKASQVRAGDVVQMDGRLLKVVRFMAEHGRARAQGFISLDLVDLRGGGQSGSGGRSALKFKPDEVVSLADLTARDLQVLYTEGGQGSNDGTVHLMDGDSYEQVMVPMSVFGPAARWLLPDVPVEVKFLEGEAVTGQLPPKVKVKVLEARAAVAREDGSTNRHVTVEGGTSVLCPGHINAGDVILVNTFEGTYVSKADTETGSR